MHRVSGKDAMPIRRSLLASRGGMYVAIKSVYKRPIYLQVSDNICRRKTTKEFEGIRRAELGKVAGSSSKRRINAEGEYSNIKGYRVEQDGMAIRRRKGNHADQSKNVA